MNADFAAGNAFNATPRPGGGCAGICQVYAADGAACFLDANVNMGLLSYIGGARSRFIRVSGVADMEI